MTALVALLWQVSTTGQAQGRAAPDVSLRTEQGTPVQLAAFKGKVVLIDFWASWCVPCKTSFPALDVLYHEFEPRGLAVLAVNLDERRKDAEGVSERASAHDAGVVRFQWRVAEGVRREGHADIVLDRPLPASSVSRTWGIPLVSAISIATRSIC